MKEGEERILVWTMEMHKPSLHKINQEWDMEVSMTRSVIPRFKPLLPFFRKFIVTSSKYSSYYNYRPFPIRVSRFCWWALKMNRKP